MSPRIAFPDPPPSEELRQLLDQEAAAADALEAVRLELDIALRQLSNQRGLTMKLSATTVRAELKMREQVNV